MIDATSTAARIRPVERAGSRPIPTILPKGLAMETQRPVAEERLYRKQRLAVAFRMFGRAGLGLGASGHITARDPEHPDCFWVNPLCLPFSRIRVSDLLLVDEKGRVLEGDRIVNEAAVAIHVEIHRARPDAVAAAHAHGFHGKVWSATRRPIEPICQDSAMFYDDHAIFNEYTGVVSSFSEGRMIADALGDRSTVLLANHGHLTVGGSVETAAWRFLAFEEACRVQLLAGQVGGMIPMSHEIAVKAQRMGGSEAAGRYSFEPYWLEFIEQEPDLLD